MPRSNSEAGRVEARSYSADLQSQYGIHTNAEEMILSVRAGFDPAVTKAGLVREDEEGTQELLKDGLEGVEDRFTLEDGEKLLGVQVRGNAIVGVIENEYHVTRKAVAPFDDSYEAPELTPSEQMQKARAETTRRMAEETAKLRDEEDAAIEEMREESGARIAALRAELLENEAKVAAEIAESEAAEGEAAEGEAAEGESAESKPAEAEAEAAPKTRRSKPKSAGDS